VRRRRHKLDNLPPQAPRIQSLRQSASKDLDFGVLFKDFTSMYPMTKNVAKNIGDEISERMTGAWNVDSDER
jgi:hypothetical protein